MNGSLRSPQDIAQLHAEEPRRAGCVLGRGRARPHGAQAALESGPLKLEDSQAAAAVGQIALARTWAEALGRHGIAAGQVLVTLQRHRGAPALSQCALDHRAGCWSGAPCR